MEKLADIIIIAGPGGGKTSLAKAFQREHERLGKSCRRFVLKDLTSVYRKITEAEGEPGHVTIIETNIFVPLAKVRRLWQGEVQPQSGGWRLNSPERQVYYLFAGEAGQQ